MNSFFSFFNSFITTILLSVFSKRAAGAIPASPTNRKTTANCCAEAAKYSKRYTK